MLPPEHSVLLGILKNILAQSTLALEEGTIKVRIITEKGGKMKVKSCIRVIAFALIMSFYGLLPVVLTGVPVTPAAASCVPRPGGLVGWWPGDGNTNDIVGSNHAVLMDGATFTSPGGGKVDGAFSLDGAGDWVEVDTGTTVGNFGTDDFTVDLWVYFRTLDEEQVLIERYIEDIYGDANRRGWTLTKLSSANPEPNDLRFATRGGASDTAEILEVGTITAPNTWYHVAVTRTSGTFRGYLNGVLVDTHAPAVNPDLDSSASLKFGHRGNPTDTPGSNDDRQLYLDGLIDEVEIFELALVPSEIADIYNAGSDGKCKCEPFNSLDITDAEARLPSGEAMYDLNMEADFTLGLMTDGINPFAEGLEVYFGTGTAVWTPAQVFPGDCSGCYVFSAAPGQVNGQAELRLEDPATNGYQLHVWVNTMDLTGTASPVDVKVKIGNDCGVITIPMVTEMELLRSP
jgi:hypothetical protein